MLKILRLLPEQTTIKEFKKKFPFSGCFCSKTAGTINTATSTGGGNNTSTVSPKTGEGNIMMMVAMFAAIGLAGMTVVVAGRKRA